MTGTAKDLMRLLLKLYYPKGIYPEVRAEASAEYLQRDLVCTPYAGNYGRTAGWVICVNGSLPKGTLVISVDGPDEVPSFYLATTARRMNEKQSKIIQAFYDEHLRDKTAGFVVKNKGIARAVPV